jgi:hypothetical protein
MPERFYYLFIQQLRRSPRHHVIRHDMFDRVQKQKQKK